MWGKMSVADPLKPTEIWGEGLQRCKVLGRMNLEREMGEVAPKSAEGFLKKRGEGLQNRLPTSCSAVGCK
jgi:hypothetical protein